ncbi:MAG TPA: SCO family protein [Allosphingosinicella sp.]|nr:SCO family protein [Allosphingosinicella sp.]
MNESVPRRPGALLALLLALALAACARGSAAPPLEGASMGGAFTLTDQNGRRVSDRDFAGKYRIVYFGYTFCPDVCPVDLQVIGAGLRQFEARAPARAARVQPIFISVDPARDTPQALRQFVAAFHPRLIGLTGSEAEVARAARAYRIFYERGEAAPGGGYMVNHTRMAVLYGPEGQPIAIVPHDQGPAGVAAELERWVR